MTPEKTTPDSSDGKSPQRQKRISACISSATLSKQDDLHVSAAEGWWLLGDYDSAVKELEQISAEARLNHGVQSLRHFVYAAKSGRLEREPARLSDDPLSWTTVARATFKTGLTAEAKRILIEAEVKFPGLFAIPFELACLCAQVGELKEAEQWLRKAMALDEKMTRQGLDVPALKALMDSMGGTTWIDE